MRTCVDWPELGANIVREHLIKVHHLRQCTGCQKWLPEDAFSLNNQQCIGCDPFRADAERERREKYAEGE